MTSADRRRTAFAARLKLLPDAVERVLALDDGSAVTRALVVGAAVCASLAVLQVAYHGIVLDEAVAAAQIITGDVVYPPGHPHEAYYKQVYSLLHYVAAALWRVRPDATFVSAVFNVLFMTASLYVPFAVATVLTRQAGWGYLAAALAALGAFLPFQGTYPLFVFPAYFSNGHIGLYAAVLAPVLMLGGCWRSAGLLLGLLPGVHGAMALIAWSWAGLYLLFAAHRPRERDLANLLVWGGAGVFVCVALWLLIRGQSVAPVAPPYDVTADAARIYRAFTDWVDTHRRLFPVRSGAYLTNPVAFFAIAALLWRWGLHAEAGSRWERLAAHARWILVLGGIAWSAVYAAWLYRTIVGPLPGPFEILMPFRLSNLTAILLVPLAGAVVARSVDALPVALQRWATVLLGVALLAAGVVLPSRRGLVPWLMLMALVGFAFGLSLRPWPPRTRVGAVALSGLMLICLATLVVARRWEGLTVLLAAAGVTMAGALALQRLPGRPTASGRGALLRAVSRWMVPATAFLLALLAIGIGSSRRRPIVTPFDVQLREWLVANAKPHEPLLPAMWPALELQPKVGHPTLLHWETLYIVAYTPRLAPAVNLLSSELLGVDFLSDSRLDGRCGAALRPWCPALLERWKNRTRAEWVRLGAKYGFRLVVAPTQSSLDLTPALSGPTWTLYTISPDGTPP